MLRLIGASWLISGIPAPVINRKTEINHGSFRIAECGACGREIRRLGVRALRPVAAWRRSTRDKAPPATTRLTASSSEERAKFRVPLA